MGINCPNHVGSRSWGGGVGRKRETVERNYPNLAFGCYSPLEMIPITPISTQRSFDIEKDPLSARFATRFDTRVSSKHHWEAEMKSQILQKWHSPCETWGYLNHFGDMLEPISGVIWSNNAKWVTHSRDSSCMYQDLPEENELLKF